MRNNRPLVPLSLRGCQPGCFCPQACRCLRAHVAHHVDRLVDDNSTETTRAGCRSFLDRRGVALVVPAVRSGALA